MSASVRFEKIALYGDQQDAPSTPGNGGCDQSRTSLRLAWRDWSRTNESLGVCSRDATVNRLIVDSVDHGIRQQYPASRRHTHCIPSARRLDKVFGVSSRRAEGIRLNDKKMIEMTALEEFGLLGREFGHADDYP